MGEGKRQLPARSRDGALILAFTVAAATAYAQNVAGPAPHAPPTTGIVQQSAPAAGESAPTTSTLRFSEADLKKWADQLDSEYWWRRREAAEGFAQLGGSLGFETLVRLLGDKQAEVREVAIQGLEKIGDPRGAESILPLVKDPEWRVAQAAAKALGTLRADSATSALIEATHNNRVWYVAIEALARIGNDRAVDALAELARKGNLDNRRRSIECLGKTRNGRALEPLVALLSDPSGYMVIAASEALGELGDARAVEPLLKTVAEYWDGNAKATAASALGKLGGRRAIDPLLERVKNPAEYAFLRRMAAESLIQLGGPDISEYLSPVDERHFNEYHVAHLLEQIGSTSATARLHDFLSDSNPEMQLQAAHVLLKKKDPEARRAIEELLEADDSTVKARALHILEEIGDEAAIGKIADLLKTEPQASYERLEAAKFLAKRGDARGIDALLERLKSKSSHERRQAVEALGEAGDRRAVVGLTEALRDKDEWLVKYVCRALTKIGDPRAVGPLLDLLTDEQSDMEMSWDVIAALGELGDRRAIPAIVPFLEYERWRYAAAHALEKLNWQPLKRRERFLFLVGLGRYHEAREIVPTAGAINTFGTAFEARFEYDVPVFVPIGLPEFDADSAVPADPGALPYIEFQIRDGRIEGRFSGACHSFPRQRWLVRVDLLDREDHVMGHANGTIENSGMAITLAVWEAFKAVTFAFDRNERTALADRFRLHIEPVFAATLCSASHMKPDGDWWVMDWRGLRAGNPKEPGTVALESIGLRETGVSSSTLEVRLHLRSRPGRQASWRAGVSLTAKDKGTIGRGEAKIVVAPKAAKRGATSEHDILLKIATDEKLPPLPWDYGHGFHLHYDFERLPDEPPPKAKTGPILTGRVTDQQGNPVSGVKVTLYSTPWVTFWALDHRVTDSDGRYRFHPVKKASGELDGSSRQPHTSGLSLGHPHLVSADGNSLWSVSVMDRDGEVTRKDFTLILGGSVSGRVVNPETREPVGVWLRMFSGAYMRATGTDAQGRFHETGLFPGKYVIDANRAADRHPVLGEFEVVADETTEIELGYAPGRPMRWAERLAVGPPARHLGGREPPGWGPREHSMGEQWIELEYDPSLRAHQVRIHETAAPGAVRRLILKDNKGVVIANVPVKDATAKAPAFLEVDFDLTQRPVRSVRVILDTDGTQRNKIDAVELVGPDARAWAVDARASSAYAAREVWPYHARQIIAEKEAKRILYIAFCSAESGSLSQVRVHSFGECLSDCPHDLFVTNHNGGDRINVSDDPESHPL